MEVMWNTACLNAQLYLTWVMEKMGKNETVKVIQAHINEKVDLYYEETITGKP